MWARHFVCADKRWLLICVFIEQLTSMFMLLQNTRNLNVTGREGVWLDIQVRHLRHLPGIGMLQLVILVSDVFNGVILYKSTSVEIQH